MSRKTYYTLSLTWGLPLTLVGLLVGLALLATGHRPKRFGWTWHFEVGKGWGGLSLGLIFLCCKDADNPLKAHEYGHTFQNCKYGPAMVLFTLASAGRYWYRTVMRDWLGKKLPDYDSWWFEGQATTLGTQLYTQHNN